MLVFFFGIVCFYGHLVWRVLMPAFCSFTSRLNSVILTAHMAVYPYNPSNIFSARVIGLDAPRDQICPS